MIGVAFVVGAVFLYGDSSKTPAQLAGVHPEQEALTPSQLSRHASRGKDLVTGIIVVPQADDSNSVSTVLQSDADSDCSVDLATMYINVNNDSNWGHTQCRILRPD
eukprot:7217488-Prymnesium_polylepis.2